MPDAQAGGSIPADDAEALANALPERLEGLEAGPADGGVDADAFGRAVIDGDKDRDLAVPGHDRGGQLRIPMGWTPPHGIALCQGSGVETLRRRRHPMTKAITIGIDIAKNVFHLHGAAPDGAVVFQRKLSRARLLDFLSKQTPCLVAMEACAGAHHWGREIGKLGHDVRLIAPQYGLPRT